MARGTVMQKVRCEAPCESGTCDLQPGHGGDMHSGLIDGVRVWWNLDGTRQRFGRDDHPDWCKCQRVCGGDQ